MPARQADELLLPERLRDWIPKCGAAVGRIRRFDRCDERVLLVDGTQEGADDIVR